MAKVRKQLRLDKETVVRLRVHAAMTHQTRSAAFEAILLDYLERDGRGRELFEPAKAE